MDFFLYSVCAIKFVLNCLYMQGEVRSVGKWVFKEECNTFDDRVPSTFDADD